jgi:hypothetical protein
MKYRVPAFLTTALATILYVSCGAHPEVQRVVQVPTPPPVEKTEPVFMLVDDASPGPGEAYEGTIVSSKRWKDASGEHMLVLSESDTAAVNARHYTKPDGVATLTDELVDGITVEGTRPEAGFYRGDAFVSDLNGDGHGEAMFVYHVDSPSDAVARRLELVVFLHDRRLSIHGTARYYRIEAPDDTASAQPDQTMLDAFAQIRDEAMTVFREAQYDLAIPPPFPGFLPLARFDGASFRGDAPAWSITLLPAFIAFTKGGETVAIRYESITIDGGTMTIEGKGLVEAWTHKFRISLAEKPGIAPDGKEFQYTATMEWSDGTRLTGWGGPLPAGQAARPVTATIQQ